MLLQLYARLVQQHLHRKPVLLRLDSEVRRRRGDYILLHYCPVNI